MWMKIEQPASQQSDRLSRYVCMFVNQYVGEMNIERDIFV